MEIFSIQQLVRGQCLIPVIGGGTLLALMVSDVNNMGWISYEEVVRPRFSGGVESRDE